MKNALLIIQVIALGFLAQFRNFNQESPTRNSKITNPANTPEISKAPPNDNIKNFIVELYDARMMNMEEAKLAITRGSNAEVRKYSEWMVSEQKKISAQLQLLAQTMNVPLPTTISKKQRESLAKLNEQSDKDFDKKFLKMMKTDHRRDVRKLKNAKRKIKDPDLDNFISTYQPLIKSHLDSLKAID